MDPGGPTSLPGSLPYSWQDGGAQAPSVLPRVLSTPGLCSSICFTLDILHISSCSMLMIFLFYGLHFSVVLGLNAGSCMCWANPLPLSNTGPF